MILQSIRQALQRLTYQPEASIVIGYKRKRSVFDMTNYEEDWLPRQQPYHKNRKPQLPGWTDPNALFPRLIPPIRKMAGRACDYIRQLELEEKQKIHRKRDFLMPDVRSGDIVEISYQETFETDKVVKYRGFVIAMTKKNSLMAGMVLAIRVGGVNVQAHYLINSPKVKNIEIIARGSGDRKARLYFLWERKYFTKSFIQQPWRSKANKKRSDDKRYSGKAIQGSLVLDKTEDDSVRRVL
jgi:ribosomal protein L19